MKTKISVSLNGKELHKVDESIIVQGVDELAPSFDRQTMVTGRLIGQHYGILNRKKVDIRVRFSIKLIGSYDKRAEVFDKVKSWAYNGGELMVNYREGKKIRVVCDELPELGNVKAWTEEYAIVFCAYSEPFWITDKESSWTYKKTATIEKQTISVGGNVRTPMCFKVDNASSKTINGITVTVSGKKIEFKNLGLAKNEYLVLEYDNTAIQQIYIVDVDGKKRNAAFARTIGSVDELYANNGNITIQYKADYAVTFKFFLHERWI